MGAGGTARGGALAGSCSAPGELAGRGPGAGPAAPGGRPMVGTRRERRGSGSSSRPDGSRPARTDDADPGASPESSSPSNLPRLPGARSWPVVDLLGEAGSRAPPEPWPTADMPGATGDADGGGAVRRSVAMSEVARSAVLGGAASTARVPEVVARVPEVAVPCARGAVAPAAVAAGLRLDQGVGRGARSGAGVAASTSGFAAGAALTLTGGASAAAMAAFSSATVSEAWAITRSRRVTIARISARSRGDGWLIALSCSS